MIRHLFDKAQFSALSLSGFEAKNLFLLCYTIYVAEAFRVIPSIGRLLCISLTFSQNVVIAADTLYIGFKYYRITLNRRDLNLLNLCLTIT